MRDLQRLGPSVLAGILPRIYPQMLEVAYRHQDEGRRVFICTAASQEVADLLAHVLVLDGAIGTRSAVVDGRYTGRLEGPFIYREGKAQAVRELADREGIDLAESWGYSDSESDLPMLRTVGHPVAVNPDRRCCASRARRAGRSCASNGSAPGCASPAPRWSARWSAPPASRSRGGGRRADEPARALDEQREIRDLARRFGEEEVAPHAATWDREHAFPKELFGRLGELGLMGVCVPAEHGGAGATSSPTCWCSRSSRAPTRGWG